MATAQELLSFAEGEVGYYRHDDPKQGTKYGRWYADYTGSPWFGTNGVPYCAMYVSYCLYKVGVSCEGFPRAVAIDRRDGFSRQVEPEDMQPGDVVGFDWDNDNGGDHVGFFKYWIQKGWSFRTNEGNTDDGRVAEKTRYVSQVTCAVRPYYDNATNPSKDAGKIDVDGAAGYQTIKAWQRQMGTDADGVLSGQRHDEDRYRHNVWAVDYEDEGSGSSLIFAVQKRLANAGIYNGLHDGCWGYSTTCAIQTQLKRWGYYTGRTDDGDFGHHSVESLQRSINDGKWA